MVSLLLQEETVPQRYALTGLADVSIPLHHENRFEIVLVTALPSEQIPTARSLFSEP